LLNRSVSTGRRCRGTSACCLTSRWTPLHKELLDMKNTDTPGPSDGDAVNDRDGQIVTLYRLGRRPVEIARLMGISISRVRQILAANARSQYVEIGIDGFRLDLYGELSLLYNDALADLYQASEEGADAEIREKKLGVVLRLAKQLVSVTGASGAGPLFDLPRWAKERQAIIRYNQSRAQAG
jgi:hypothetical protein